MTVSNADLLTIGQELAEVTRLVEADDPRSVLERLVARVERTVPGCDYASVTIGSPGGGVETVAGADVPGLGYPPGEPPENPSPILDTVAHGEPRRLDDIDIDRRWPAFAQAMRDAGFRSAISLPLATDGAGSAVFTLFSRRPGQFTDTSYDLVMLFVLHAGVVFDNASLYHDSRTLVGNLRQALATRALIGQAQGLVMASRTVDAEEAVNLLKRTSQNHNVKLRELARTLVDAHEANRLDAELTRYGLAL